jgi:predicted CopG family antitoxin
MCVEIIMPNMTLSIPEEIYHIVKSHKEIRWSEIARKAIADYAKKLALMDAMLANSELTEEDVMKLDKKIKKGIHKYYMELLKNENSN